MPDIKLSFCIPTYNRANFLGQTLSSIADQITEYFLTDSIEVCISDNASTDNTDDVIHKFKKHYPSVQLVYSKNSVNLGADRNYLKVVEIANGEYCWLMGSDDIVPPGAIAKVLCNLNSADIHLLARTEADFHLNKLQDRCWLIKSEPSQIFDFSNRSEIIRYFKACRRLGGVFSYLSSIVVRRKAWVNINFDESFIGSAYSHVYILLSMVMNGCKLAYGIEPLIISRAGNDSFYTDWVRRGLIDLKGYEHLGQVLIPDTETRHVFLHIMHHEHTLINIIKSKATSGWNDWQEYVHMATTAFGFPIWKLHLAVLLYPLAHTLYLFKKLYKKLQPRS